VGEVALDADVVIAFLDSANAQHRTAVEILEPRIAARDTLLMPASVYAEILVQPLRTGVAEQVDRAIADLRIQVLSLDRPIARQAAELRAKDATLRLPDALALATAFQHRAAFLTLDLRLRRIAERYA
jgi:predicted nucleic acid-binding protein